MTSIREQLILADKDILDNLSWIQKVDRKLMDYEKLRRYAVTQLPVAAVIGKLPKTETFKFSQREVYTVDKVHDDLEVDVFFYFQRVTESTIDQTVSTYANDLYAALFANPGRDNLCLTTVINFEPEYFTWDPYVAFKLTLTHRYIHTTGGI